MSDEPPLDIEAFIAASLEGLRSVTSIHQETWNLGGADNWSVDQNGGELVWTFDDGTVARAPVQIVGTYSERGQSFMWGWNHPSILPPLQEAAWAVKAFGEEHGVEEFTTHKVECSEMRAWEYTALAMRLTEANGAYRAEASPGTFVFMTFGEVQLSKE